MSFPAPDEQPPRGIRCKVRRKKRKEKLPITLVAPLDGADDANVSPPHSSDMEAESGKRRSSPLTPLQAPNACNDPTDQIQHSSSPEHEVEFPGISPTAAPIGESIMELYPIRDADTKEPLRDSRGKVIDATHVVFHKSVKTVVPNLNKESIQAARKRHLEKQNWIVMSSQEWIELLRLRHKREDWQVGERQFSRLPLDTEMMGVTVKKFQPTSFIAIQPVIHEQDPNLIYEFACTRCVADQLTIYIGSDHDLGGLTDNFAPTPPVDSAVNPFAYDQSSLTVYQTSKNAAACNTLQEESVTAQYSEPQGPGIWGELERLETTLPRCSAPPDALKQQHEDLKFPAQTALSHTNQQPQTDTYTADIIDGMISGLQKRRDSGQQASNRKYKQIPAAGCSQQECIIILRSQMNLPAPSAIDCRTPLCRRPIDWYCPNCVSFICTKCSKTACGALTRHDIIDFEEMYEDSKRRYVQWKNKMESALEDLAAKMEVRDQITAEIQMIAMATQEDLMSANMARIFADLPTKRNQLKEIYLQIEEINDELNKYGIDINKVTPKYFIESFDIFDHCIRQTEKGQITSGSDDVTGGAGGQNKQDAVKLVSGAPRHSVSFKMADPDSESSWPGESHQ